MPGCLFECPICLLLVLETSLSHLFRVPTPLCISGEDPLPEMGRLEPEVGDLPEVQRGVPGGSLRDRAGDLRDPGARGRRAIFGVESGWLRWGEGRKGLENGEAWRSLLPANNPKSISQIATRK